MEEYIRCSLARVDCGCVGFASWAFSAAVHIAVLKLLTIATLLLETLGGELSFLAAQL